MNKRSKIAVPLVIVACLVLSLSLGAIHPVKALTPVSTVYITPNVTAPVFPPATVVVFNVTGDLLGTSATSGINGWEIVITDNDPTFVNLSPASITMAGNLLTPFGGITEIVNCVNAGSGFALGTPGNIGCNLKDGPGVVHSALVGTHATPAPISGLLFQITYNVIAPGSQSINVQPTTAPGCAPITGNNAPCDSLTDGTIAAVPHVTLGATYATAANDFGVTPTNPAPFNPGASSTGSFTATSFGTYTNTLSLKTDVSGFSGPTPLAATALTVTCGLFAPNPIPAGLTSSVSCTFSSNTPGIYVVTANVTDATPAPGTFFHLSSLTVKVGDFSVGVPVIPVNFPTRNTGSASISVASINGFSGPVAITASAAPAGLTVSCTASITAPSGGSAPGTCTLSSSTPGTYSVTVTGTFSFTGGTIVHQNSFTVNVGDFSITGPISATMQAGSSGSVTLTLTSQFNFNRLVLVTGSSAPAGVTVACGAAIQPTPAGASKICTLTSTTPGGYTLTFTGTCAAAQGCLTVVTHTTTVPLAVSPDFIISATSPAAVGAGVSATSTITVTAVNGFTGSVALSDLPLPANLSCQDMNPASVSLPTSPATATLSCTSTVTGSYAVTITGTSGSLTHTTTATFTFTNLPDWTISATSPRAVNVGETGTSTITVTPFNGFSGSVSLSDAPLPAALTCRITPSSVSLPPSPATATVSCSSTTAGTFTVTVTGTSTTPALTRVTTVTFTFVDFTITAGLPAKVNLGQSATSTITVTAVNGFTGTVTLTNNATTTQFTVSCVLNSLLIKATPGTNSTSCTITPNAALVAGTYHIGFSGTSGYLTHTATATFTFVDFTITASTPAAVLAGSSSSSTITLTSVVGFEGSVALSDTPLPSGLTCGNISPANVVLPPSPATVALSCSASTAGTFTVTITGISGLLTHTTTVTFKFTDFSISATSPAAIATGVSATSTITVTAVNGFAGSVTLSDVPLPSGVTCQSISPGTISGSGSATLSCSSINAGSYTVTITATSGSKFHTAPVTLTVSAPLQVPPSSQKIFGLDPIQFYGLVAGVIIAALAGALGLYYRRRQA
ncbi:MAG TPA: hypothetical protein VFE98_07505 [Candidatus Bathyarchaeia archaeon]|nr:hypothetical protein [Candidatus Bathyarchaeia archaeon]